MACLAILTSCNIVGTITQPPQNRPSFTARQRASVSRTRSCDGYFLRKRSSRTTSAPPDEGGFGASAACAAPGFAAGSDFAGAAACSFPAASGLRADCGSADLAGLCVVGPAGSAAAGAAWPLV